MSLLVSALQGRVLADGHDSSIKFVYEWGTEIVGEQKFKRPYGVAVGPDDNEETYVYVADTYNNRIVKFGPDGKYEDQWDSYSGPQPKTFNHPYGVAVGPDDDGKVYVYIADTKNNRIVKLDPEGEYDPDESWPIVTWASDGTDDSGPQKFQLPQSVAVGRDDDGKVYVYVADTNNHRIVKFTADGEFVTKWGTRGSDNNQFDGPKGVAVGADGSGKVYVYVADTKNNRIVKFDSKGEYKTQWVSYPDGSGKVNSDRGFGAPSGVAVGPDGSVYVADTRNDSIVKFDPEGKYDTDWHNFYYDTGQFIEFKNPYGVAVVPDDHDDVSVYYAAGRTRRDRIVKFTDYQRLGADGYCASQGVFSEVAGEVDFDEQIDCGAVEPESMIEAGQLKLARIEPQSSAGSLGSVNISFTTTNPVHADGKVVVILPLGFKVGLDTNVVIGDLERAVSRDIEARSVTVAMKDVIPSVSPFEYILTLTKIKHPEVSGIPEGGSVETQNSRGDAIDKCAGTDAQVGADAEGWDCQIVYTKVKPGTMTDLVFDLGDRVAAGSGPKLSNTAAGSTGEVTVSFTTTNPVPEGGLVKVIFPVGFEVGSDTKVLTNGIGANDLREVDSEVSIVGRTVTIRLSGETSIGADVPVTLTLDMIKNPVFTGDPQGGGIVTYNTAGVVIDGACEIESDVSGDKGEIVCAAEVTVKDPITPGKLEVSENGVVLDNKKAGGTGKVTVTFRLDNPLPPGGTIAVTFPEGFILDSEDTKAKLLEPNEENVTVTVIEHEDGKKTTALIIRSEPGSQFDEDDVVKLELTHIRNPQVSGHTHNFEIRTSVGK